MSEDSWHQARLIPTSGISGADEQERRATSALLAVMGAVREFGRAMTQPLGAPVGSIETFIEVPFSIAGRKCFPDGLIRVRRGQRTWTALVEVKTGASCLDAVQLETYLDVAREQGFDALLTISNEISPVEGLHPVPVDKRKLRAVGLHHYSWSHLLAEAVMQKEHRGVADPDQAWILGELIRYLEHPRSGALEFEDMGSSWVSVRDAVAVSTLRPGDPGVLEVTSRFDALLRYAGLRLGRQLGTDVVPQLSRRELADPGLRSDALRDSLTRDGVLAGTLRIPDAIGPIVVTADLRAGKVSCHVDVDAPREGRATTRVNWVVRQLRNAPGTTRVEAFAAHARGAGAAELLRVIREDPTLLVSDASKELRGFRIALEQPLGTKRGRGRGAFIDSVLTAVDAFYGEVVQGIKAWTAIPPRLRDDASQEPVDELLISSSLSSQDDVEELALTDPALALSLAASLPPEQDSDRPEPEPEPEPGPEPELDRSEPPSPRQSKPFEPAAFAAVSIAAVSIDVTRMDTVPISRSVSVDPPARPAPPHPSRREIRLIRQLVPDQGPGSSSPLRAEAGWYQDPDDDRLLRWFDGAAWSERTYPAQPALT